ncbi:hypothetical protein KP509_03G075400 [Ceratopteris richardii]|uniref:Protein kinase domain-containing protein n=1 Tax=Ceratopteris richardii TaxID=49495 RepID=A0A8T2V4N8_CERRI|nr:hypothetical protein KP509_03G075400 [Ceratopteris richardii]
MRSSRQSQLMQTYSAMSNLLMGRKMINVKERFSLFSWTSAIFTLCIACFTLTLGASGSRDILDISSSNGNSTGLESDAKALLAMKAALIDNSGVLESWNISSGTPCVGRWVGVKCENGRIIGLHLPGKGLRGTLAAEIGQLTSLRHLSIHNNAITGTIPSSISALGNLRGLFLFHNRLTGNVPYSLSPVLQVLDLSHNLLSGAIPASLASSTILRRINLSYNNLSLSLPDEFSSLARLQSIIISHNQLTGSIPYLFGLLNLETLDLSHNLLTGPFPALKRGSRGTSSITALSRVSSKPSGSSLVVLNLSYNALSGTLPSQVGELTSLLVLDLSRNEFTGAIPSDLGNIADVSALDISYNNFTGELPSSLSSLTNLTQFNCSFNNLTGPVPKFSHTFEASSFVGNKGLCGFSSDSLCGSSSHATSPAAGPEDSFPKAEFSGHGERKKRFSALAIVSIVIGIVVVLFLVSCLCSLMFVYCCRKSDKGTGKAASPGEKEKDFGGEKSDGAKKEEGVGGKLVHFEGSLGFSADDLLCATAEVVGKSTYGTVYKATIDNGSQVAVKRLREGIVKSQYDFEVEVAALGAIRHPNLLALRAYYWGPKNEKLLIFDFMQGGSLAAFIHARGPETPLTWQMRMNIAVGAARGLVYLHEEQKMVHGNLTSSNILIDAHQNAKLSDFGLYKLMTQAANLNVIATAGALGYRAPELTKLRNATNKSDVYSFGIVLLELLTGKAPGEAPSPEPGFQRNLDLPEWVSSIVNHQWTQEVFDVELMKGTPGDEELIDTLQLAMACVKLPPVDRPEMVQVLQQLEQINPDLRR